MGEDMGGIIYKYSCVRQKALITDGGKTQKSYKENGFCDSKKCG